MVDPDLIAYFDQRFRQSAEQAAALHEETAQQIAALREETTQQITALREETAQQFAAMREETTQQFAAVREETAQQFAAVREETAQQFAAVRVEAAVFREETAQRFQQVEDTGRQTLVLVEGLRSHIDLLAEGFGGLNERLERLGNEVTQLPGHIKGWVEPYLRNLDSRVRVLEGRTELPQPPPQA
jgi:leucyl aminopeptidase (aminopeptidase T)